MVERVKGLGLEEPATDRCKRSLAASLMSLTGLAAVANVGRVEGTEAGDLPKAPSPLVESLFSLGRPTLGIGANQERSSMSKSLESGRVGSRSVARGPKSNSNASEMDSLSSSKGAFVQSGNEATGMNVFLGRVCAGMGGGREDCEEESDAG